MPDGRDLRCVDVGRRQILRRAEIGVHGALAVRRHQNVGAAGGGTVGCRLGFESDAGGADVIGVEAADLVVPDLADIGGARAEAGDADDGVGRRAAATSRWPGPCRHRSRRRGPRRSAPCRPWSCRVGPESPRRSAPARRKSHCRSRERRISLSVIDPSCLRQLRCSGKSGQVAAKVAAAYHDSPAPASCPFPCWQQRGCYTPGMIRSFLTVSTGTLASRLLGFVRDAHGGGAARRGAGRGCVLVAFSWSTWCGGC